MINPFKTYRNQQAKIKKLESEVETLRLKLNVLQPKKHGALKQDYIFAFEIEGEKFYKWKDMNSIPVSRKIYAESFLRLSGLVISPEELKEHLGLLFELVVTDRIDETKTVIHELMKRLDMMPLPRLIFKLMAQIYFKEDDDFELDLPVSEIDRRAELFERAKKKTLQEIFTAPMIAILGLSKYSKPGSQRYLKSQLMASQMIADLQQKTLRAMSG